MSNWPKKITVDKRIVKILSIATYQNFPKALKEIITNSYDAGASLVQIDIDEINEIITITDNGEGMSEEEFDFYLRIAFRSRTKKIVTKTGRKVIGQFGVGFLSVFPFCNQYEIESKKRGTNEIVYSKIPTSKYFTSDMQLIDVADILIPGGKRIENVSVNKQYTKVTLRGFSELTREFFNEKPSRHSYSIHNYTSLQRLIWQLADDLPIEYRVNKYNKKFLSNLNDKFEVEVNGKKIYREVYGNTILLQNEQEFEQVGNIKYKYFISTDFKPIQPPEARGIKIRNLNVGVGNRTSFGIGIEGRTYATQSNLTGELLILEGLNELIALSRDDFNHSNAYEELKQKMREYIAYCASTLEYLSDIEKISKHSVEEYRLLTLDFLEPVKIISRLEALSERGFKINYTLQKSKFEEIILHKSEKKIVVVGNLSESIKKIKVNEKIYKIKTSKWDYEKDLYPACKMDNNSIVINKNYPFFSGRKYLDIFFKLHVILLIELHENIIDKKIYKNLINEITKTFSDYK